MSVSLMTEIWKTCLYPGATRAVLLVLADHGHDNGTNAYPGVALIAAKTLLSERQVKYSLRQLEEDEVITPEDDEMSGGRHKSTRYFIDLKTVQRLHRLHQTENKDCKWCKTRVHVAARNGALRDRKGANGGSPIRKNHQEPPIEPLSASENSPSVKPKEEPSSAWPEIWTAFQGWPGSEKQDWSERKAKTAWEALTPRPPDTDLILCIRAKGRDYAEENLRRKARGADAKWPTNPARWLGERLFDRLLDEARKSVTATLAAEAARPMALSEPIRERLITAGVATGEIKSYFAGCVHRHGPPEEFIFETDFAANLCENRCGPRLRRESAFGEDLIIAVAKKASVA